MDCPKCRYSTAYSPSIQGYGYESGDGCGSTAATEVVDSAPLHLPADFECKIMTPAVFLSLTKVSDDALV